MGKDEDNRDGLPHTQKVSLCAQVLSGALAYHQQ